MQQPETKMVKVAGTFGAKTLDAELLAKTSKTIGGTRFQFIVTRVPGDKAQVTDQKSGCSAAEIRRCTLDQCSGDFRKAALREINALIEHHGEDRVKAVLLAGQKST